MIGDLRPDGGGPRYFGLYPAIVTGVVDPDELGRVEVKLPWLGEDADGDVRAWATLLTPYADDDQGIQFVPAVDSQVVVAFEAGDLRRPYVVGACWNGKERMPERPTAANDLRLIHTRAGSRLEFDDTQGAAKVTVSTASGHKLVLDDGGSSITIEHANGSVITLNPAGQIEIRANATVEVTASAVNVHAATANFDGMVTCTTLIASAGVVSPSYTPGAGNVW
jgi:uncharacterized protein involved in type VI secretion and phage assembly